MILPNKQPHPLILEVIRRYYTYDPETGTIFKNGKPTGSRRKVDGAISVNVGLNCPEYIKLASNLFAHHIAWYLYHNEYPSKFIDHIDGNPSNNRISNLRLATISENTRNSRKRSTATTSKFKGVCRAEANTWRVQIRHEGKVHTLGHYASEIEAAQAYDKAAKELHGEFARLNFPTIDYTNYQPVPLPVRPGSSKYRGVRIVVKTGRWVAVIHHDGKDEHLGTFATEVEAAQAWDKEAIRLRGKDTRLNFPQLPPSDTQGQKVGG